MPPTSPERMPCQGWACALVEFQVKFATSEVVKVEMSRRDLQESRGGLSSSAGRISGAQ